MANEQEKKFRDPKKGRNLLNTFHAELIEAMEAGLTPAWQEDWKGKTPPPLPYNGMSTNPYSGINIFLLEKDYEDKSDPRYYTFKQIDGQARINKGAKAHKIVFFDMQNQYPQRNKETNEIVRNSKGEPLMVRAPFIDVYNVFNASQTEGLPAYEPKQILERTKCYFMIHLATEVLGRERDGELFSTYGLNASGDTRYMAAVCSEISEKTVNKEYGHRTPAERALRAQIATYLICRELGVSAPLQDMYLVQTNAMRKEWLELLKNDRKAFTTAARDASSVLHTVKEIQRANEEFEKERISIREARESRQELSTKENTTGNRIEDARAPKIEVDTQGQDKTEEIAHIKQETSSIPAPGVSAADIATAKVVAQNIINNEALMKGDMVNEGHEKNALNAAIQAKRLLNKQSQLTYATERVQISKQFGRGTQIIEGAVNKSYGPGVLKLYEKTAILSLSRNLKIAYDLNDLKGQMPEANEKEIPVDSMRLNVDKTDNKETREVQIVEVQQRTGRATRENER